MLNLILTISGLILTIFFGIFTLFSQKNKKKNVALSFEKEVCFNLFKKEVNDLNIEMKYDNKPINNYLIIFKASIINDGINDIDKSRIYKPLELILNDEYKWLEVKVLDSSAGINEEVNIVDEKTISIDWDLLKSGEKLQIECLVEVSKVENVQKIIEDFFKIIKFDFRITDLNKITTITEPTLRQRKIKYLKKFRIIMIIISLLFGSLLLFSHELPNFISVFKSSRNVEYSIKSKIDGVKFNSKITQSNKDTIEIDNGISKEYINKIDFNNKYQIIDINMTTEESLLYIIILRVFGIIYILMPLPLIKKMIKKN